MKPAFFFDFDGVVLDSARLKTAAFHDLFLPYGEAIASQVVKHHLAHGGISRYVKIAHYLEHLLNEPVTDIRIESLAEGFSELVYQKVLAAPFIPGFEAFIERHANGRPCFVVSGTPEVELLKVTAARDLDRFFVEVTGSPPGKIVILERLLGTYEIDPKASWFFGDANTDQKAARATGMQFCLIRSEENPHLEAGSDQVISHWEEFSF